MARGGGTQLERRGGSPQPGPQVFREGSLPSPLLSLHSSRQRTLFGHCRSPACSSAMATIFDGIRQRQPDVANDWAISTICHLITAEGERLAQRFKPEQKKACFGNRVNFLSQAEVLAPSTCQLLCRIAFSESSSAERIKKQDLVFTPINFFTYVLT